MNTELTNLKNRLPMLEEAAAWLAEALYTGKKPEGEAELLAFLDDLRKCDN